MLEDEWTSLPGTSFWLARQRLMTLEGGHKATLPIPEISGSLKIFIEPCWILWLIDHHGIITMLSCRDSRLSLSHWLKDLSQCFSRLCLNTKILTASSLTVVSVVGEAMLDFVFDFELWLLVLGAFLRRPLAAPAFFAGPAGSSAAICSRCKTSLISSTRTLAAFVLTAAASFLPFFFSFSA